MNHEMQYVQEQIALVELYRSQLTGVGWGDDNYIFRIPESYGASDTYNGRSIPQDLSDRCMQLQKDRMELRKMQHRETCDALEIPKDERPHYFYGDSASTALANSDITIEDLERFTDVEETLLEREGALREKALAYGSAVIAVHNDYLVFLKSALL
jgi:hypothetical protein